MYLPINYEKINAAYSSYTPTSIKLYNNESYRVCERALFQRISSKIKADGLPAEWLNSLGVKDFLYYCLLKYGYIAVAEDSTRGIYFNPCTLKGYNFYYQPTKAIINNPAFTSGHKELEIGKECELIKITPDYMGLYDIVAYYAEKLALIDCAINTSLINSKIPYIIGAKTKSAAQALKTILDKVNSGDPAVFYDSRLENAGDINDKETPFHQLQLFDSGMYITDKLLEDRAKLLNSFDVEVGIQSLPYEKKERMVTDEANSKKGESLARITLWLDCLNESAERVNAMFGTNIKFSANLEEKEVSGYGDESDSNRNGAVSE